MMNAVSMKESGGTLINFGMVIVERKREPNMPKGQLKGRRWIQKIFLILTLKLKIKTLLQSRCGKKTKTEMAKYRALRLNHELCICGRVLSHVKPVGRIQV